MSTPKIKNTQNSLDNGHKMEEYVTMQAILTFQKGVLKFSHFKWKGEGSEFNKKRKQFYVEDAKICGKK